MMIILNNNNRVIEFALNCELTEDGDKYKIKVPEINCTNKEDAEKIQKRLDEFIFTLSYETLKLKK